MVLLSGNLWVIPGAFHSLFVSIKKNLLPKSFWSEKVRTIEAESSRQMRFVQITRTTARILLKILELESKGVTVTLLSETLRMDRTSVYDFIKEAERDSRQFLDFNEWSSTKRKEKSTSSKSDISSSTKEQKVGRHTDILEIRPDRLITNPLSAKILLMLAQDSIKSREINRKVFMKRLNKELNYLKGDYPNLAQELAARVNFLIKIGDICTGDDTVPNIIWISWLRYHSQKAYLELLVREKLPKLTSA